MEDPELDNVEEARKMIRELRQKMRAQTQQLMAWRRAYKMQESLTCQLQHENANQLKALSSKLLLFESRLLRKQKDISTLLIHRENIIYRQQKIIETLTNRLVDNGLEPPIHDLNTQLDTNLLDLDSLNDSDSAVVMEDIDSDSNIGHIPRFRSSIPDCITVMRSVSDAIDPSMKYSSRRSNGFLRRPEILETVYSVEEDGDSENQNNDAKSDLSRKRDAFASHRIENHHGFVQSNESCGRTKERDSEALEGQHIVNKGDSGYCEVDITGTKENQGKSNQVITYNRVMSNHRSVTKPKDVKYKRINKAKSKSLEELRGRLKSWVEHGNKLSGLTLEHSQSYA